MRSPGARTHQPPPRILTRDEWWISFGFLALVLGLLVAEIIRDYRPEKLAFLGVILFWMPLVAVHELGHAAVAHLVGWHVCRITIGFGRPLRQFRIGSTRVEICAFPLEGFVVPAPTSESGARWKSALVYAGGPGVELLILGVLGTTLGWRALFDGEAGVTAQSLAFALCFGLAFTLIPYPTRGAMSDGLGIILSPFLPRETIRGMMATPFRLEALEAIALGEFERAEEEIEGGLTRIPGSVPLSSLRTWCFAARGDLTRASRELEALQSLKTDATDEIIVKHTQALVALESGQSSRLAHAVGAARQAWQAAPDITRLQTTYGWCLTQSGYSSEAVPLLEEVASIEREPAELSRALAGLILALHRSGEEPRARQLLPLLRRGLVGRYGELVFKELGETRVERD